MKGSFILFWCCCYNSRPKMEIPDAFSFSNPRKKGYLLKLTGRSWLYSGSWKKRLCVLDGTKFYYYENEKSRGSDRTSGVLNLDYYDVCDELRDTKDKKTPHVFVIGTSVRGFFDNRHQFASETEAEMQGWIRSVHDVIVEARNIRSRGGRNRIANDKVSPAANARIRLYSEMSNKSDEQDVTGNEQASAQLVNATKDRAKGPPGRRPPQRKSMMPTGTQKENDITKQRSFSLSSPSEEEDSSPNENRRISLSMEILGRSESDEVIDNQRSNSNHDIPVHSLSSDHDELKPAKKLSVFGKLGGQHAALTKELELKLKSGLAPGGRRFPIHELEEESPTKEISETAEVDQKIEGLNSKLGSMQRSLNDIQQRINSLEVNSNDDHKAVKDQLQEMLKQAANILKEAEETNSKCSRALADAEKARDEQQKILKECQETLSKLKCKENGVPDSDGISLMN